MKTETSEPRRGFTLIDLLLIVAAIVVLAAIMLPRLARTNGRPPRISCVNNLKQIGSAFRIWAREHNDLPPMSVSVTNGGVMELAATGNIAAIFQVMSNELSTPKILFCPTDKLRRQANVFATTVPPGNQNVVPFQGNTSLSYFVNLDAVDTNPSMFLSGDDNLLIGGQPHDRLSGSPAMSGVLPLTTNSLIAWSEARHEKQGNVALADGSVQQLSTSNLRRHWETSGVETNRLAMP
jgi:prepilin-type processing-associated H-X9-DG protein